MSNCVVGGWHGRTLGREMQRGLRVTWGKTARSIRRSRNLLSITPIRPSGIMRCSLAPSARGAFLLAQAWEFDSEIEGQRVLVAQTSVCVHFRPSTNKNRTGLCYSTALDVRSSCMQQTCQTTARKMLLGIYINDIGIYIFI